MRPLLHLLPLSALLVASGWYGLHWYAHTFDRHDVEHATKTQLAAANHGELDYLVGFFFRISAGLLLGGFCWVVVRGSFFGGGIMLNFCRGGVGALFPYPNTHRGPRRVQASHRHLGHVEQGARSGTNIVCIPPRKISLLPRTNECSKNPSPHKFPAQILRNFPSPQHVLAVDDHVTGELEKKTTERFWIGIGLAAIAIIFTHGSGEATGKVGP